jgi:hypothetical protein
MEFVHLVVLRNVTPNYSSGPCNTHRHAKPKYRTAHFCPAEQLTDFQEINIIKDLL